MDITLAINKHRSKLEEMILAEEDYEKIVKQSQKLDKYINIAMKEMAREKGKAEEKDK